MNEQFIWTQLRTVRQSAIAELKDLSEEQVDQIPEGFRNNIRWNAGHIYVVQESLIATAAGQKPVIPEGYDRLFKPGTKPADWEGEVPNMAEIINHLQSQSDRLAETFSGMLDDQLAKPFELGPMTAETLRDVFGIVIYHDGLHTGFIKGLKRAIGC